MSCSAEMHPILSVRKKLTKAGMLILPTPQLCPPCPIPLHPGRTPQEQEPRRGACSFAPLQTHKPCFVSGGRSAEQTISLHLLPSCPVSPLWITRSSGQDYLVGCSYTDFYCHLGKSCANIAAFGPHAFHPGSPCASWTQGRGKMPALVFPPAMGESVLC